MVVLWLNIFVCSFMWICFGSLSMFWFGVRRRSITVNASDLSTIWKTRTWCRL